LEGKAITSVERVAGDFVIEARLLAQASKLSEEEIRARMHDGIITSRCELGLDEDTGCWRLTFYNINRACRFIVDAEGTILKTATFPVKTQ
jgi:hypothetical protein